MHEAGSATALWRLADPHYAGEQGAHKVHWVQIICVSQGAMTVSSDCSIPTDMVVLQPNKPRQWSLTYMHINYLEI